MGCCWQTWEPVLDSPAEIPKCGALPLTLLSGTLSQKLHRLRLNWMLLTAAPAFLRPQLLTCLSPSQHTVERSAVRPVLAVHCGIGTIVAAAYAIDRSAFTPVIGILSGGPGTEAKPTSNVPTNADRPHTNWYQRCRQSLAAFPVWCSKAVFPVATATARNPDLLRLAAAWLSAVLSAELLAKGLRRGLFDWTAFALLAPFLAPFILAALDRVDQPRRSVVTLNIVAFMCGLIQAGVLLSACITPDSTLRVVLSPPWTILLAGTWLLAVAAVSLKRHGFVTSLVRNTLVPGLYPMSMAIEDPPIAPESSESHAFWRLVWLRFWVVFSFGKRCGSCKRAVPIWSRAHQQCPHCNVYWSYERNVFENFRR